MSLRLIQTVPPKWIDFEVPVMYMPRDPEITIRFNVQYV